MRPRARKCRGNAAGNSWRKWALSKNAAHTLWCTDKTADAVRLPKSNSFGRNPLCFETQCWAGSPVPWDKVKTNQCPCNQPKACIQKRSLGLYGFELFDKNGRPAGALKRQLRSWLASECANQ